MSSWPFKKAKQSVSQLIDMDYIGKLSPAERAWMEMFVKAEYLNDQKAAAKMKGKKLTKAEKTAANRTNYIRQQDASLFPSKKKI